MKRLRLLFVLLFALIAWGLTAWSQEPTVTLNGSNYTLQPHPRAFLNSALNTRVAYSGSVAPKALSSNPTWVGLGARATALYAQYGDPSSTHNYDSTYQDGSIAAEYAMYYYSDNSQTTYQAAALYLLNNIQQYVPLICDEAIEGCLNSHTGYDVTSYGPAYWMENWILAYELMRPSMTTPQRQTFADKFLNDLSLWGGVDGEPSTSCTNPSIVGSTSVTISSSGVVTASAPYFGSGQTLQVGDWIEEGGLTATIASISSSTVAAIESDQKGSFSGYSGTLVTRSGQWTAGQCGWWWVAKHNWYSPYSIIGSTTAYPSPDGQYGGTAALTANRTRTSTSHCQPPMGRCRPSFRWPMTM
jgi:hypothetical protein